MIFIWKCSILYSAQMYLIMMPVTMYVCISNYPNFKKGVTRDLCTKEARNMDKVTLG